MIYIVQLVLECCSPSYTRRCACNTQPQRHSCHGAGTEPIRRGRCVGGPEPGALPRLGHPPAEADRDSWHGMNRSMLGRR